MSRVYLSLGTNLGDRRENLDTAVRLLREQIQITEISSIYETEPVGYKDQPWFLNIVLAGETTLSPYELLAFTQGIERRMKRVKLFVNGPRIIDVDILLYDNLRLDSETLTLPHPRMLERAFVLAPLANIAPGLILGGKPAAVLADSICGEAVFKRT